MSTQNIILLLYSENKGEIALHSRSDTDNWQQIFVAAMTVNPPLHGVLGDGKFLYLVTGMNPATAVEEFIWSVFTLLDKERSWVLGKATSKHWL